MTNKILQYLSVRALLVLVFLWIQTNRGGCMVLLFGWNALIDVYVVGGKSLVHEGLHEARRLPPLPYWRSQTVTDTHHHHHLLFLLHDYIIPRKNSSPWMCPSLTLFNCWRLLLYHLLFICISIICASQQKGEHKLRRRGEKCTYELYGRKEGRRILFIDLPSARIFIFIVSRAKIVLRQVTLRLVIVSRLASCAQSCWVHSSLRTV